MAAIAKPSGMNVLWASKGVRTAPDSDKQLTGWVVETPPYQYDNWLMNKYGTFMAHVNQYGLPVWDAETAYNGGKSYALGSDGVIYRCIKDNTNLNPIVAANSTYWERAFDNFGAAAEVAATLTAFQNQYKTLAGIANVGTARANLQVYSRAETDAKYALKNGDSANVFNVAPATAATHAITLAQLNNAIGAATTTNRGTVLLATDAEVGGGTETTKAVTPASLPKFYLSKAANFSDVPNKAVARQNLGLGTVAVLNTNQVLQPGNDLADVSSRANARANLELGPMATAPWTAVLRPGNNLGEITSAVAARANLGLGSASLAAREEFMQPYKNLTDLTHVPTARAALGLGTAALYNEDAFLVRGYDLGDVPNKAQARINLGLGSAAVRNAIGFNGNFDFTRGEDAGGRGGFTRLPNGLVIQYGRGNATAGSSGNLYFRPMYPLSITLSIANVTKFSDLYQRSVGLGSFDNYGFQAWAASPDGGSTNIAINWVAIGVEML